MLLILIGCEKQNATSYRTFEDDRSVVASRDPYSVVLSDSRGESMVLVSPGFQGKVFTSTTNGSSGMSIGWVNHDAILSDKIDYQMNAYGGENRLWVGPEGSRFSLYFDEGKDFSFENWRVPPPIDREIWKLDSATSETVWMSHSMEINNRQGKTFMIGIRRSIDLLDKEDIEQKLTARIPEGIKTVAYSTENTISNRGEYAWTRESGTVNIWMLDMFTPSDKTVIILPFRKGANLYRGAINTNYFGPVGEDRLFVDESVIFFRADGKSRGKVGVGAKYARSWLASYDPINEIFSYVSFSLDTAAVYLNQVWEDTEDPYDGDAVNAYNDGPLENGSQLGPFYELESSSPAAFLQPGESLLHIHNVFHFSGEEDALGSLIKGLTGYSLEEIERKL